MMPMHRRISHDNFSSGYRRTESGKYVAWVKNGEDYQRVGPDRNAADAAIADIRELRKQFEIDRYEELLCRYREMGPVDPADAGKRFELLVNLLCRIGLEQTAALLIFPGGWCSVVVLLRGALADKRTVALSSRERSFLRACIRWGIRHCVGKWRLPVTKPGELSLRALAGESLSRKFDQRFPGWDTTEAEVYSSPWGIDARVTAKEEQNETRILDGSRAAIDAAIKVIGPRMKASDLLAGIISIWRLALPCGSDEHAAIEAMAAQLAGVIVGLVGKQRASELVERCDKTAADGRR